jgi:hypothetical protein
MFKFHRVIQSTNLDRLHTICSPLPVPNVLEMCLFLIVRLTWEEYKEKHKEKLEDRLGELDRTDVHSSLFPTVIGIVFLGKKVPESRRINENTEKCWTRNATPR